MLDVDLLDGDGKPTEFLFDSPFLDLESPMTPYEWCAAGWPCSLAASPSHDGGCSL